MTRYHTLLTVFSHVTPPANNLIRQHVVYWSPSIGFSAVFRDVDKAVATLEPDIGATDSSNFTDIPLRTIGRALRIERVIRVAFYDVRVKGSPILVLDTVGVRASYIAIKQSRAFIRVVLRNALSPHTRERPPQSLELPSQPLSEWDFFGPIFAAGLNAALQDIDEGDSQKTTALLDGVQIADKYNADLASPAWYGPRPASDYPNLPNAETEELVPTVEDVPAPVTGPGGPFDRRLPPTEAPATSSIGGRVFRTATTALRKIGIRINSVGAAQNKPRTRLRVADLPGHYRDGEAPQWFPAGPFTGSSSIPFADALGIQDDLQAADLFAYLNTPEDSGVADEPHWTRRMRVTFERGPPLPQNVSVRTIELAFTRAFHTKQNVILGNTIPGTGRAQLPISLSLRKRRENLDLRRFIQGREDLSCQFDGDQYRFVQRQPPLWCAERPNVADAVKFLVAIEEVDFKDVARMWNRDVAGRYYSSVASARNDRRLSFFPRFTLDADNLSPDADLPADNPAELSSILGGSNDRFSLIFGLEDRAHMFDENNRFNQPEEPLKGLVPTLWRIEPGPLRNAADRALAVLYTSLEKEEQQQNDEQQEDERELWRAERELSRAEGDPLMTRLISELIRRAGTTERLFRPERLHLGRPQLDGSTETLERLCRGVGDLSSILRSDALLETNPDTDLLDEDATPPEPFDPPLPSWTDIAAFGDKKLRRRFVTELFSDTEGDALEWEADFDFLASISEDENASAPDNRIRLTDLRGFAGLADRTRPTGYDDQLGPNRAAFFAFTFGAVTIAEHNGEARVQDDGGRRGDEPSWEQQRASRLGAYDITFAKSEDGTSGNEQGAVAVWLAPVDYRDAGEAGPFLAHADIAMTLKLSAFRPGTQDDIEGADLVKSSSPILVPLVDRVGAESANYSEPVDRLSMRVAEKASHLTRQSISLTVNSQAGIPGAEMVVIDQQPFFVAKVGMDRIEGLGSATAIAFWDSDASLSPTWRIAKQAAGYNLTLPSPSVGESVARDNPGRTDAYGLEEGELADFRFSPPVMLRLGTDPRFAQRNEVEPPFNTRRIFGTANDRAPFGAPLFEAAFELLYGLGATVRGGPDQELREIGTDIGRPPRRLQRDSEVGRNRLFVEKRARISLKQEENRDRLIDEWSQVVSRIEARPAILSLRRRGAIADGPLSDGVEFRLRANADIAAPVDLDGDLGETPYGPGGPRHADKRREKWEYHLDGETNLHGPLEGGADAGFHSANIYRELWRKPEGEGGELTGVSFTALGAGGAQRATFANGKQRIISRSSQGRTHYYSLERVGRIGCYWNKAKHVVVFERTTSPTLQFEYPMRLGSPTLRKVREYVEILQPYRPFPEDGAQAQRAGPVRALRFDEIIIPVDSTWGSDVGRQGWKLPLYQVGAVGYVPPPIDFEMAVDPRGGNDARLVRSLTPERFVFYTSTLDEDGADTDEWARVLGVDAPLRPVPRPRPIRTHLKENVDAPLPDEEEIPLGFEPFTHEIDTSEGPPIDLGARRTAKPMVATLKNLTVTRGALPTLARSIKIDDESFDVGEVVTEAQYARAAVRDALGGIADLVDGLEETGDQAIDAIVDERRDDLKRRFQASGIGESFRSVASLLGQVSVTRALDGPGAELCKRVVKEAKDVAGQLEAAAAAEAEGLRGELDAIISIGDGALSKLEEHLHRAQREIDALRQLERDAAQAAIGELNAARQRIYNEIVNVAGRPAIPSEEKPELNGVIDDVTALVESVFPNSRTPLHSVLKDLPNIAPISKDAVLAPVRRAIDELSRADRLTADLDRAHANARRGIAGTRKVVAAAKRALDKFSRAAPIKSLVEQSGFVPEARIVLGKLDRTLARAGAEVDRIFDEAQGDFGGALYESGAALTRVNDEGSDLIGAINAEIEKLRRAVTALKSGQDIPGLDPTPNDKHPINQAIAAVNMVGERVGNARSSALEALANAKSVLRDYREDFGSEITLPDPLSPEQRADYWDTIEEPIKKATEALSRVRVGAFVRAPNGSYALSGEIIEKVAGEINNLAVNANSTVSQFCDTHIAEELDTVASAARKFLVDVVGDFSFTAYEQAAATTLKELAKFVNGDIDALKGALDDAIGSVDALAERALGVVDAQLDSEVGANLDEVFDTTDTAVRLYRAFGDPPTVPSLNFNRETLGYFFDDRLRIDTTPAAALFDRVGNDLKGLGLRVPTTGLTERLLPKFDDFKISDLFPDIGGIKLDKLLEQAIVPDFADDYVNITHGVDKEARTGWIDATVIPIQISGSEPLFELFGLAVVLREGTFSGSARQEIGLEGQQTSEGQGKIEGNWALAFGGKDLVTFESTPLSFDQMGKFDFGVSPENVRLAPELSFIDKFLNSNPLLGGGGEGFTVGILQEGLVPVGVECLLDLPIPPMVYGTTGVSGLRLIAGMQLRVVPDFSITVHAAIGSIETPFTITIFILGGTGWIQTWGKYTPRTGEMQASVSLAIGASAMLGFSFGPINGSVQVVVAIKAQLITSNRSRDQLSISLLIICTGQVNVAGLISASLLLVMELRFADQGRTITGTGTVSFRIRISRFFTYRISQSVTYTFKGNPNPPQAGQRRHVAAIA